MDELKKQNMAKFVEATRAELHKIWDLCFYGSEQRREFAPAFCSKERIYKSLDPHPFVTVSLH